MEKIHPAIFSNRKNPQKDKLQLSVDSEETVMKSEEIVRLKIHWTSVLISQHILTCLREPRKATNITPHKKSLMGLVVIIETKKVLRKFLIL